MGKGGRQVVPAPPLAGPSSRPGSAVSRPGSATASRPGTKDLRHRAAQRRAQDPASDKARLRSKFIEQVKSYIGVPYAERYHKEGDALHGQPLYLDCCGLFRQVLRDMREDFGFDVGRGTSAICMRLYRRSYPLRMSSPATCSSSRAAIRAGESGARKGILYMWKCSSEKILGAVPSPH